MKNKQGFTLVEIIVSIGLLALIGVAVGISLNKTFKKQEVKSYQEYVEKIKSSAMLYASNTVEIVNKLNSNASFQVITIEELINKGYISEKLENPQTKEKIDPAEKVKVYYNENSEMEIEYPYVETNEIYLYAMNFSVNYNENNKDLCYKDLNKSPFQLINEKGEATGQTLKANETIKAYLEDGTPCYDETKETSKIDTSKIGTYKIKYEYTIDGKLLSDATSEKKIIERTITVKPSKPNIQTFAIKYQEEDTSKTTFDVYKANMKIEMTEVEGVQLKYCLIGVSSEERIENVNSLLTRCKEEAEEKDGTKQIGEYWEEATNGVKEENKIKYTITKNFNIQTDFQKIKDYSEVKFYLFVKNSFEENSNKLNSYNEGIYRLTSQINFHLLTSDAYFKNISKTANNIYSIKKIENDTPFKEIIIANPQYARAYRNNYVLMGWSTTENGTVEYNLTTTTKIRGVLNLYAVWKEDTTKPTCSLKLKGSKIVATVNDNHGLEYYGWESSYAGILSTQRSIRKGETNFYAQDYAGNKKVCTIKVIDTDEGEECTGGEKYTVGSTAVCSSLDCYAGDGVPSGMYRYNNGYCQCWRISTRKCEKVYTCKSGYKKFNDLYCYKQI